MIPITSNPVLMGADPEVFISLDNNIIGSEKVIPEKGLDLGGRQKIIVDGVACEINPAPESCRAYVGNNISSCFKELQNSFRKQGKDFKVDFSQVIKIKKEELASLAEKNKVFGCAPSSNVYDSQAKIKVNPKKYLKRSAGGHLHFGVYSKSSSKAFDTPQVLVPMFDAILGNTCVLLDRNKFNVERRKNYGRAGEYRKKSYGIEYRTLSNFWLRSYPLMSFVMGTGRFIINLVSCSLNNERTNNYVKLIQSAVPREKFVQAIQENNFDLAYDNFNKIEPIILEAEGGLGISNDDTTGRVGYIPIGQKTIKAFHYFVNRGIDYWFPHDPFEHWTGHYREGHGWGIENFLMTIAKNDMEQNQNKEKLKKKTLSEIWRKL